MDEDSTQLRCLKNSLVSFFPMGGGLSVRDRALAWSGREDVFGFGQIASMTEQPSVNSISRPWGWRLRHLVYTTGRAHTFVCGNDYCIISFCNYKNVKVAQSCPTLCDPMDDIVHRILQARILERVTIPFSKGSS